MSAPPERTEQDTAHWRESQERVAGSRGYVDGRVTHLVELAGTGGTPTAPQTRPPEPTPEEPTPHAPNTDVGPSS